MCAVLQDAALQDTVLGPVRDGDGDPGWPGWPGYDSAARRGRAITRTA
ncbi:hypothetical protein [Streptomyces sp. NPDC050504]